LQPSLVSRKVQRVIEIFNNNGAFIMNPRTKSIIIGLYFGDGSITKPRTQEGGCYMMIQHSIKQLEYTKWLKEQLSEICNNKEVRLNKRLSGKFKNYIVANFETHRHPFFNQLRGYYKNGKKTIKRWMLNWLTPEALAIWYMDDGSKSMRTRKNKAGETYKYLGGVRIAACGYSVNECKMITEFLKNKYKLDSKIYLTKGKYPVIFFNVESARKLVNIIQDYIPDCMKYKVSIERETLDFSSDDVL
jgi:recombination protein RecA